MVMAVSKDSMSMLVHSVGGKRVAGPPDWIEQAWLNRAVGDRNSLSGSRLSYLAQLIVTFAMYTRVQSHGFKSSLEIPVQMNMDSGNVETFLVKM